MVIPLATALVAVGIGLAVIGLLGRLVYIPDEAPTLGTMLGLGVGIDYALFLVTRHRTLLRRGFEVTDSVGRTAGTAGAGMVFAGATLLAAVMGLSLTGISFLAWLGYSAAVVVALALLAALTLVPALMGLMGVAADPVLHQMVLLPTPFRQLAAIATLVPAGLLLGMPFPLGMRFMLDHPRQRAYAWAANGCASVVSSVIAVQIALSIGLTAILWAAVAAYVLAWLTAKPTAE